MPVSAADAFRATEARVRASYGLEVREQWIDVADPAVRVRVQVSGEGPPVVFLNGVGSPGMGMAPLVERIAGCQVLIVDLPGHGLAPAYPWSGPPVRELAVGVLSGLLDGLGLPSASLVANSLGGMFALWLALDASDRVPSIVVVGEPGIAFPGARGNAVMGALTTPGLGRLAQWGMTRPAPRRSVRNGLAQIMGQAAAAHMSDDLVDLYAMSLRIPGQAASFRSLLRRLLRGRQPRPENVLTDAELDRLGRPLFFVWGTDDALLSPQDGAASVQKIHGAGLEVVPGGHTPWFDDIERCAELVQLGLTA